MSGYSGTPLARKLGVKPSSHVVVLRAPESYAALLDPLPDGVVFGRSVGPRSDNVHVFVSRRSGSSTSRCARSTTSGRA